MSRIVPFALILLSQLCDLSIAAQSLVDVPELASFVREPYEGLDPDQIPTGYLVDAAIAIAPRSPVPLVRLDLRLHRTSFGWWSIRCD